MAKIVARNVKIISAGKDLSGQYNNSVLTLSAEAPEVTSYGNDSRQRLADGIRDIELTIDGFYNDSASSTDATFRELTAASVLTTFFPRGYTASMPAYQLAGIVTQYEANFPIEDAATISATISGSGCTRGKGLGYISDSAGSTTGCTVDFTAADDNTVYYQVHYLTMPTNISACIQHSTDDVTYSTAEVIAAVTASGIAVSGSLTSANRYRRLRYAYVGGTGVVVASISGSSV